MYLYIYVCVLHACMHFVCFVCMCEILRHLRQKKYMVIVNMYVCVCMCWLGFLL